MRWLIGTILLALPLFAQQPAAEPEATAGDNSIRFMPLQITLDPQGRSLAAYQLELRTRSGQVKIVGLEGGDHPAFNQPPYYDARALMQDRIIIAAFSTDANLPTTATRVTTVHLQVLGNIDPEFDINLTVAADANSQPIDTLVHHQLGEVQ